MRRRLRSVDPRAREQDLDARSAWRGSLLAVLLNLVGMPLDMWMSRSLEHVSVWPEVTSILVAAVLLVILIVRRHRPTIALAHFAFLLNVLAILAALWFSNIAYAESGRPWVPFQANKLGMVTVALLAPQLWVGLLSIGAFVAAAAVQLPTFSAGAHERLTLAEPGATFIIGLFSAVLLIYRIWRHVLERDVARSLAEKQALEGFARTLLAVRDLANTPIQTITFASAAARLKHPDAAPILDRIDRATEDIRALDERLREYERGLTWPRGAESFDGATILDGRGGAPPPGGDERSS